MAVTKRKIPSPPLDKDGLERLALHYVARYATTRARLQAYLARKVRDCGWSGGPDPDLAALADRLGALGYIDDRAFAAARARSLGSRGYGKARVRQALFAAGIGDEDAAPAHAIADAGSWSAALRYAEKRRIGPYASEPPDRPRLQKAIAAMVRAGHDYSVAKSIACALPGQIPDDERL